MNLAEVKGPQVDPSASCSQGTNVLFQWAKWQSEHQTKRRVRVAVFRREGMRLLVHQYGYALCGVLQMADVKPKMRAFREWKEPFQVVQAKLLKNGYELVSDTGEVCHGAH